MKIDELLNRLEQGTELMVDNHPFTFAGKATIELDGGDIRFWLYDREGGMLAISVGDEEVVYFRPVEEELEPEDEMVTYQGKDYEFSYEDTGVVTKIEEEADAEEDDRYRFADYENEEGELVRLVTNEDTEDVRAYDGWVVVEDDIMLVE